MVYELSDIRQLPYTGNKGDYAFINNGINKYYFVWRDGTWRNDSEIEYPYDHRNIFDEPNV